MIHNKNQRALLYHIMKSNREKLYNNLTDKNSVATPEDEYIQMTETRIYIGLNDSETKKQKFKTEKYMSILKNVCQSYHVAFSVGVEQGGYFHENGEYTEETSFCLLLIDAKRDVVKKVAGDLCAFFNQESVLVTENVIGGYFISEEIVH